MVQGHEIAHVEQDELNDAELDVVVGGDVGNHGGMNGGVSG